MKRKIFLLVFVLSINLFAFDIKNPKEVDYLIGYGTGKLQEKPDYEFSILSVNFSYPISSVWDFQLEPFVSYVFEPEENFEIGLSFFFKYNFLRDKKFSPYIRGGSGIIYISQDTYEQSTDFNFVDQICTGFKYVYKNSTFFLEYRFRHISNAGIDHPNSGLNSNLYLFGFFHQF